MNHSAKIVSAIFYEHALAAILAVSVIHAFGSKRHFGSKLSGIKGASVAKWLAHLPFTSEAAGSSLTKYFLNATRTQSSCEKSKSQRSAESRGFSPGTPVSSHRES